MEKKSLNGNQLPDALFVIENAQIFFPHRKLMPTDVLKDQTTPQQKKTQIHLLNSGILNKIYNP